LLKHANAIDAVRAALNPDDAWTQEEARAALRSTAIAVLGFVPTELRGA